MRPFGNILLSWHYVMVKLKSWFVFSFFLSVNLIQNLLPLSRCQSAEQIDGQLLQLLLSPPQHVSLVQSSASVRCDVNFVCLIVIGNRQHGADAFSRHVFFRVQCGV